MNKGAMPKKAKKKGKTKVNNHQNFFKCKRQPLKTLGYQQINITLISYTNKKQLKTKNMMKKTGILIIN